MGRFGERASIEVHIAAAASAAESALRTVVEHEEVVAIVVDILDHRKRSEEVIVPGGID